ncbi:MAG: DUF3291 domain-containing protein [Pseudomonadota bacterium]
MPFAQFNIALARWDLDDPRMKEFMDMVPKMNAIAARSPGYVWRLEDEAGPDAPTFPEGRRMTFTLSVWESVEELRHFTWNTLHKRFRLRTAEWFVPLGRPYLAIWPIATGHRPNGAEALDMLDRLTRQGPSKTVFGTEALLEPA